MTNPEHNSEIIGEDGLTDREREFITTPVSQMDPDSRRFGLSMLDKRAEHNYKQNEIMRAELAEKRQAALIGEQHAA